MKYNGWDEEGAEGKRAQGLRRAEPGRDEVRRMRARAPEERGREPVAVPLEPAEVLRLYAGAVRLGP